MNEIDAVLISLAIGVTIGAVTWDRLRADLVPRVWNSRNEQRLRELSERLAQLVDQLARA